MSTSLETTPTKRPQPPSVHRWHDQDFHLSELTTTLERMSEESRYLFALLLCDFSKMVIQAHGSQFIRDLQWRKMTALLKSKQARRWYDTEPMMHRAFNLLYSLQETDREWVAQELYIPSRLVGLYETHCQLSDRTVNLDTVCQLVEKVFQAGPQAAQKELDRFQYCQ